MQLKPPVVWLAIFFSAFFLSLLLALLTQVVWWVALFRAILLGCFFLGIGALVDFIFRKYLSEAFNFPSFSLKKENSEDEILEDIQESPETSPVEADSPLGDSSPSPDSSLSADWGSSIPKESSFSDLQASTNWEDAKVDVDIEGLAKLNKDSFRSEDPSLMAETIRNIIIKGDTDKNSSGKG
jgi:hypothetical protein